MKLKIFRHYQEQTQDCLHNAQAGCHSSVVECLCIMQAVLGSIFSGYKYIFNSVLLKQKPVKEREYI